MKHNYFLPEVTVSLFLIITFQFFFCTKSSAQFVVGAELRPRLEFRDGYKTLPAEGSKPAAFVSQRTRLNFSYTEKKFSIKVSLQDVRTWGNQEQVKDVPSLTVHQAYGEVQLSDHSLIRVGRQELVYDDERLLGNSNWAQTGRSHDAALFKYSNGSWSADAAGAFNQQGENLAGTDYSLNNYKVLAFGRLAKSRDKKYNADLMFISDGFQGTDTTKALFMRYTYGVNTELLFGDFKIRAIGYGQSGTDISNKSIAAFLFSIQGYYSFKNFIIGIGNDYLSGNDAMDTSDQKNHVFNTLYATNHPLYGNIDYFENIPADTKNGGLMDSYLKLQYNINPKIAAYADYHYFKLTGKVMNPEDSKTAINSYLGSEIDIWLLYKITDGLELRPGYCTMIATKSMNVIKGGGKELNGNWAYVQLTFSPTIFKFEKK